MTKPAAQIFLSISKMLASAVASKKNAINVLRARLWEKKCAENANTQLRSVIGLSSYIARCDRPFDRLVQKLPEVLRRRANGPREGVSSRSAS